MNRVKTLSLYAILIILLSATPTFALTFTGTAPQVDTNQTDADAAFSNLLTQLSTGPSRFENIKQPDKMINAFTNAVAYSNSASPHRSLINYQYFALSFSTTNSVYHKIIDSDDVSQDLEKYGDIDSGINDYFNVHFAMKCSFITEGLYLGFRFTKSIDGNFSQGDENHLFKINSFGITASYTLIGYTFGTYELVKWKGIILNSGLLYQHAFNKFYMHNDTITTNSGSITLTAVDPALEMKLDTTMYTVPIEIITSVRLLLLLNLHFGVGADFHMKRITEMTFKLNTEIEANAPQTKDGTIAITDVLHDKAGICQPKIMAGGALNLGTIGTFDLAITYFTGGGATFTLSGSLIF